jgi:hypothetical protein
MPFTHATPLGRRVKLEDWQSFHRDRLLALLYTLRDAGDENGLTLDQIKSATGLDATAVALLVASMVTKPKLVESTINNTWIITSRGVRWVEESPKQP